MTINVYGNYGNILQKYALHRTLKKFTDFTEVLWNNSKDLWTEAVNFPNIVRKKNFGEIIRIYKFKEFENRYIKMRFDITDMKSIANDYDFFIVGSDQVWNPDFISDELFLTFASDEQKIAYAASIASRELPSNMHDTYKRNISSFANVSVREKSAINFIEQLTGKTPSFVVDPVFLLTPDEWMNIAQKPSWFNEKYKNGYILTYLFKNKFLESIKSFAQTLKLPVIEMMSQDQLDYLAVGPEEFIYLFANASLIYTNSFHGTAFSILFKRPFAILLNQRKCIDQRFERINSLLELFNLQDRILISKERFIDKISSKPFVNLLKLKPTNKIVAAPLEMNYTALDDILQTERDKSLKFLSNALGL